MTTGDLSERGKIVQVNVVEPVPCDERSGTLSASLTTSLPYMRLPPEPSRTKLLSAPLLEVGVNLIYIRDMLDHALVTTTEIYAKTNPEVKCRLLEEHGANYSVDSKYSEEEEGNLVRWLKESS